MKNYADRGGCYPPKPKAEADNTLRDLHNSSYNPSNIFARARLVKTRHVTQYAPTKIGEYPSDIPQFK